MAASLAQGEVKNIHFKQTGASLLLLQIASCLSPAFEPRVNFETSDTFADMFPDQIM
jgi:hypothetical protein